MKKSKYLFGAILVMMFLFSSCNKSRDNIDRKLTYISEEDTVLYDYSVSARAKWTKFNREFLHGDYKMFKLKYSEIYSFRDLANRILKNYSSISYNQYYRQYLGYSIDNKKYVLVHFFRYYETINGLTPDPGKSLYINYEGYESNVDMLFDYDTKTLIFANCK